MSNTAEWLSDETNEFRNTELEALGPLRKVTDEEREAFKRDGFVLLKKMVPQPWVDYLETVLADCFSGNHEVQSHGDFDFNAWADVVEQGGGQVLNDNPDNKVKGKAVIKTDVFQVHPGFFFFTKYSPLPAVVADLMHAKQLNLYEDQIFNKEAGSGIRTAFHQDASYFHVGGETCCVCWVSPNFVDRENGAMGYVRESHKWGKLFQANLFAGQTPMPGSEGEPMPDIEGNPDEFDIQYVPAEPGDMIIHDFKTLHGAVGNTSSTRGRQAASIRYTTEDTYFTFRKSAPEVANVLRDYTKYNEGDALDGVDFPKVWPR